MNKRDMFLAAMNAGSYLYKGWILEAFSIVRGMDMHRETDYPYTLAVDSQGRYFYRVNPKDSEWMALEGATPNEAPYRFHDRVHVKTGDITNLFNDIDTCYGDILFNYLVLIYAFGSKVEYLNKRLTPADVEALIVDRLRDDPKPGEKNIPTNALYIREYIRFSEAMFSLAGLTQLCVPSATPKTMTTDPKMGELRAKLLEENKDHLSDPVVVAKINDQLIKMDRAWMKGDEGEGFYIKSKSYDVVRRKLYGMLGGEDGFGDGTSVTLIETPLNDGWDISKMPAMVNSLRDGSYNRGAMTELGGVITKEINRYANNSSISEEDCGTRMALPTIILAAKQKEYIGNYIFEGSKEILLTNDNIAQYVGTKVNVRSPIYCHTEGVNYCTHCAGLKLSETPQAIGSYMSDVGSAFLNAFMKMMHGKVTAVAEWDYLERIM